MAKKQTTFSTEGFGGLGSAAEQKMMMGEYQDTSKLIDAALLPSAIYLKGRIDKANTTTSSFLENMPDDFSAEKVPLELQLDLKNIMKDYKSQYSELARNAGEFSYDVTSEEYVQSVNQMEKISQAFLKWDEGLQSFSNLRDNLIDVINNPNGGATAEQMLIAKEIVGKEAYKNLDFTLDGVFYTRPNGEKINIKDLKSIGGRELEYHGEYIKTQQLAVDLGNKGSRLNIDEDGNPLDANSRFIANNIATIFTNEAAAKDITFGGIVGDASPEAKLINLYLLDEIAEENPMFSNIKVQNGKIVQDENYLLAIDNLKKNFPTDQIVKEVMKVVDADNLSAYQNYMARKSEQPGGKETKDQSTILRGQYLFPSQIQGVYKETKDMDTYNYGPKGNILETKPDGSIVYKVPTGLVDPTTELPAYKETTFDSYDDWWSKNSGWPGAKKYIKTSKNLPGNK
jgi:hypothetical protein